MPPLHKPPTNIERLKHIIRQPYLSAKALEELYELCLSLVETGTKDILLSAAVERVSQTYVDYTTLNPWITLLLKSSDHGYSVIMRAIEGPSPLREVYLEAAARYLWQSPSGTPMRAFMEGYLQDHLLTTWADIPSPLRATILSIAPLSLRRTLIGQLSQGRSSP